MAKSVKNPFKDMFKGNRAKIIKGFHRPEGAGNFDNMDDDNFAKSVNVQQGTIQHTPSNDKDIMNKEFFDDNTYWDRTGTNLSPKTSGDTVTGGSAPNSVIIGGSTNIIETDTLFNVNQTGVCSASEFTAQKVTIDSDGITIDDDADYLALGADQDIKLYSDGAGALKLTPSANTDITVTFEGTTNSGVLKWMEDEDYFQYEDEVKFNKGFISTITSMNYGNDPPYQEDIETDVGAASGFPDGYTQLVYENNLDVFYWVFSYGDTWYCSDRMDSAPLDPGNGM